jgi:hypothetical protein
MEAENPTTRRRRREKAAPTCVSSVNRRRRSTVRWRGDCAATGQKVGGSGSRYRAPQLKSNGPLTCGPWPL